MNILAFDTSDRVLSVALYTENGIWQEEIDAGSRHSELLMESIDNLFKISSFSPTKLDCIACMKGPGSFTGLRIGFSAAKGIATALGIPLHSFSTLDCLARHLSVWPGIVIPAIDAKKGCFFAALYYKGECLTDYLDVSPEIIAAAVNSHIKNGLVGLGNIILTGSGAPLLKSSLANYLDPQLLVIDPDSNKGRANELINIIIKTEKLLENDINSGPVYLRKSDAELNWA